MDAPPRRFPGDRRTGCYSGKAKQEGTHCPNQADDTSSAELEVLLETPLPTSGKRHTPVDPETYRRQVADTFRHVGYDWGADADITDELESIIKIGDGFLDQEDHASASTIYQVVAEEVLSHYDTFEDEGGELCGVVNDCVEGLGSVFGNK